MPCEEAEQLRAVVKGYRDEFTLFGYRENRSLAGDSNTKANRLSKEAQGKMQEASNALLLHVGSCPVCRADA